ncbi:hypothetical protein GeomeDRAFT_3401 [Geobacter metallireducens RCH3]|uniref:Guanylate cyclase domain-containing protein n=1 Tax=Geobacter metallireducens (strain ATCC 53774 / DSM 7210 / GS-15) TaxID=269799 RepID=Q39ZJ3_GEOMG|nr:hypothetical protein [Geobacter metallireducens]ABB30331.1 hypothetical protein Gmet_0082 [Geobacter metallireducens GS-15]EHP83814.1 hypothetical protein GeomeDRAFT_3401 [Geobacter metallireducens RCH3]
MTQESDMAQEVMAAVLVFDICSSTDILEDLHRTDNLQKWRNLLIGVKKFIVEQGDNFPFRLYNFTGDGWILLFDHNIDGEKLLPFIRKLCTTFKHLYEQKIHPVLETPPEIIGLTIGMDRGRLIKIRLNHRDEYVGRPLNVACRLQSAIKDRDKNPANKMLMTKNLYNSIKQDTIQWRFTEVERTLRNIAGSRRVSCMKLMSIEPQNVTKRILHPPLLQRKNRG